METKLTNLDVNAAELADRWWSPVLRGGAAIAFSLVALLAPGLTLLSLVYVFAFYAFADGILRLALAVRSRKSGRPWGMLIFAGVVGLVAGVVAAVYPAATGLALLVIIASWAIVTGIAEIAAAVRLRKQIDDEWILGLTGVLSVLFGGMMLAWPGAGALALVTLIGAYAMAFGVLNIALGLRLRSWRDAHPELPA